MLLEPALEIASYLLQCPASEAFMHSLLYCQREKDFSLSQRAGFPCYDIRRSLLPLPHDELPRSALYKLKDCVRFHTNVAAADLLGEYARTEVRGAPCVIANNNDENLTPETRISETGPRRHGYCSTIRIREDIILALAARMRTDPASLVCLSYQVWMAKLFCHEIMHAFNAAVDSEHVYAVHRALSMWCARLQNAEWTGTPAPVMSRKPVSSEPFFGGQRIADIGSSWENEVFGGQLLHRGGPSGAFLAPLLVLKWPHHDVGRTLSLGYCELLPSLVRKGPKKSQTTYIVPAAYVIDITRPAFWDPARAAGTHTATIPKELGVRSWIGPEEHSDDRWFSDESSEGECEADENHVVYRGYGWGESVAEETVEQMETGDEPTGEEMDIAAGRLLERGWDSDEESVSERWRMVVE